MSPQGLSVLQDLQDCQGHVNASVQKAERESGRHARSSKRAIRATCHGRCHPGKRGRGTGLGGVKTHHVVRDLYSGARIACRELPTFCCLRANELANPQVLKKDFAWRSGSWGSHGWGSCENLSKLEEAAHQVGFIPETSLPNRWPHNAHLERDIREEKECCRSIHLQWHVQVWGSIKKTCHSYWERELYRNIPIRNGWNIFEFGVLNSGTINRLFLGLGSSGLKVIGKESKSQA